MTEDSPINITDSVVLGDVHQNMGAECPSCSASNVRVMKCQEKQCSTRFCELCHADCRYSGGSLLRFDSGKGLGPFCSECLAVKLAALEKEREKALKIRTLQREKDRPEREARQRELARLERERVERKQERDRLERETRERDRLERERLEREQERDRLEIERRNRVGVVGWGKWKRELGEQECVWCGFRLVDTLEFVDEEERADSIFNCESNHGPFCHICWDEFSEACPDCSNEPVTGMAAERRWQNHV